MSHLPIVNFKIMERVLREIKLTPKEFKKELERV